MNLSSDLVSEFAKVMNEGKTQRNETTVYGTIAVQNGITYVKIDGSDELTPVVSTVTVGDGQRVIVTLKQHQAVVTSNLTDPAASSLMVGEIGVNVNEYGIKISGITEFTNGLTNGKTTIDGACIKTGTLKLTNSIVFDDLDEKTQELINDIAKEASDAADDASDAYIKASSALSSLSALETELAKRLTSGEATTLITKQLVSSPVIQGGRISGAKFANLDSSTWIEIGKDSGYANDNAYALNIFNGDATTGEGYSVFHVWYNGDTIVSLGAADGYVFLSTSGLTKTTQPLGTWDFSNATVTGLEVSGPTTVTAVFA